MDKTEVVAKKVEIPLQVSVLTQSTTWTKNGKRRLDEDVFASIRSESGSKLKKSINTG